MSKPVRVQEVTHEQFARIQLELTRLELGAEDRVIKACEAVGIKPPTMYEDVSLIVVD